MFNALKSIKRLRMLTFLMVFQLAFGLSLINNVIFHNLNTIDKKIAFTTMFDVKNTYLVRVQPNFKQNEIIPNGEFLTTKKVADEIYKLKDTGIVRNVYSCFNNPKVSPILEGKNSIEYSNMSPEIVPRFLCNLVIDENFIDKYSFEVDEGRGLSKSDAHIDYETQEIPILLGQDYKNNMSIGDTFKGPATIKYTDSEFISKEVSFKVVGFLEKDSAFTFLAKTEIFKAVTFSNSIVVIPGIKDVDMYSTTIALNDVGIFIEGNDGTTHDDIENKIRNVIKDIDPNNVFKYEYKITSLNDDIASISENFQNDISTNLLFGVVLTILSLVGITTTILGELNSRNKEIGTRISVGATIKALCIEQIYEIMFMITISIAISNLYLKFTSEDYQLSIGLIIANIVILIIFTIVISIMPILRLKNYNVIDLLREEL